MQTPQQVVDSLLRNKPADRIGLYDSPWPETVRKWVKEENYPTHPEEEFLAPAEHFNFDMTCVGGWFDTMPLRGHSELLEESDEWEVKRNGGGAAFKYWKNRYGTPEHIDFRMISREIWDRDYRSHLLELDPLRVNIENTKKQMARFRAQNKFTFFGHHFIWEQMRSTMGDICMYESLLLDPDWIHDFNRVYTDFYKAHYKLLIEKAGKPDGVWMFEDLGYSKGLICSPDTLEQLVFPYFKEMIDFFHNQYDLPVVLHSCGNITEALPYIVDLGFDALNPMEAKAGASVTDLAKQYSDKLAFIGGMDARIYATNDHAQIKAEVTRIINLIKDSGARYVFGSDHSIPPDVTCDSFQYAVDIYRENMMY